MQQNNLDELIFEQNWSKYKNVIKYIIELYIIYNSQMHTYQRIRNRQAG